MLLLRICWLLLLLQLSGAQIIEGQLSYPPMFVRLPLQTSMTILQNTPVDMHCGARSKPASEYQWFLNGVELPQDMFGGKLRYNSTVGRLQFLMDSNLAGEYVCRATTEIQQRNGSRVHAIASSGVISVQLASYDLFIQSPSPVEHSVRSGDYVLFSCSPPTFVPNATLEWFAADRKKVQEARFFVEPNGDLHVLSATNGSETQPNGFSCCAYSRASGVSTCGSNQRVVIQNRPQLWLKPTLRYRTSSEQAKFNEGDRAASITCAFSANPLATVEWRRADGLPVLGTADAQRNNDTLKFGVITRQLAGTYQCRGLNRVNTTWWYDVNVTVRMRPSFVRKFDLAISVIPSDNGSTPIVSPSWQSSHLPRSVKVGLVNASVGDTVVLDCTCAGEPEPTVTWTLNSVATQDLDASAGLVKRIVEQLNSKMIVRAVEQTDNGNVLACKCVNVVGRVMRIFGLMVFERTRIVERPQASNFTVNGYRLADEANTLVMDLDERGAANAQQMRERSALRCGARSDASTRLSVDWWNTGRDTPVAALASDGPLNTQAVKRTRVARDGNTGDDADWLIGAMKQQSNGIQTAIVKFNIQRLVEVAWERRERQSLFWVSLECRATNTLSRDSLRLNVVLNATAYVRARMTTLAPPTISTTVNSFYAPDTSTNNSINVFDAIDVNATTTAADSKSTFTSQPTKSVTLVTPSVTVQVNTLEAVDNPLNATKPSDNLPTTVGTPLNTSYSQVHLPTKAFVRFNVSDPQSVAVTTVDTPLNVSDSQNTSLTTSTSLNDSYIQASTFTATVSPSDVSNPSANLSTMVDTLLNASDTQVSTSTVATAFNATDQNYTSATNSTLPDVTDLVTGLSTTINTPLYDDDDERVTTSNVDALLNASDTQANTSTTVGTLLNTSDSQAASTSTAQPVFNASELINSSTTTVAPPDASNLPGNLSTADETQLNASDTPANTSTAVSILLNTSKTQTASMSTVQPVLNASEQSNSSTTTMILLETLANLSTTVNTQLITFDTQASMSTVETPLNAADLTNTSTTTSMIPNVTNLPTNLSTVVHAMLNASDTQAASRSTVQPTFNASELTTTSTTTITPPDALANLSTTVDIQLNATDTQVTSTSTVHSVFNASEETSKFTTTITPPDTLANLSTAVDTQLNASDPQANTSTTIIALPDASNPPADLSRIIDTLNTSSTQVSTSTFATAFNATDQNYTSATNSTLPDVTDLAAALSTTINTPLNDDDDEQVTKSNVGVILNASDSQAASMSTAQPVLIASEQTNSATTTIMPTTLANLSIAVDIQLNSSGTQVTSTSTAQLALNTSEQTNTSTTAIVLPDASKSLTSLSTTVDTMLNATDTHTAQPALNASQQTNMSTTTITPPTLANLSTAVDTQLNATDAQVTSMYATQPAFNASEQTTTSTTTKTPLDILADLSTAVDTQLNASDTQANTSTTTIALPDASYSPASSSTIVDTQLNASYSEASTSAAETPSIAADLTNMSTTNSTPQNVTNLPANQSTTLDTLLDSSRTLDTPLDTSDSQANAPKTAPNQLDTLGLYTSTAFDALLDASGQAIDAELETDSRSSTVFKILLDIPSQADASTVLEAELDSLNRTADTSTSMDTMNITDRGNTSTTFDTALDATVVPQNGNTKFFMIGAFVFVCIVIGLFLCCRNG